jgi:hypothetical protein
MSRSLIIFAIVAGSLSPYFFSPGASPAFQTRAIASEHVSMLLPPERELLGRGMIMDVERCYGFVNRATDGSLPRKIYIRVDWDRSQNSCNWRNANILIGMEQHTGDLREFLYYNAAREIARMGLLELSQGAQREDTMFLFEGMVEIMVREYTRTSRRLEAAWAISKYLDEMKMLGFATQRSWSKFSGKTLSYRNLAPGITFLTTFRALQGREQPVKLFKALKKKSLAASLKEAFGAPIDEVESTWLKRVREYPDADEITAVPEDVPQLAQVKFAPEKGTPGTDMQIRLFINDSARNLLADGVFVRDERTGSLLQVQEDAEEGIKFLSAPIPVEADCKPGEYKYRVTAIDEAGNLRRWNGTYTVASSQ